MNIWIFHHYAIPPNLPGIKRHYFLAQELKKHGHNPVFITADRSHRNPKESRIKDKKTYVVDTTHNVPMMYLRAATSSAKHASRVWNMLVYAWRVLIGTGQNSLEDPDIVIGCTPDLFTAYAACRIARRKKVPFVLHVGDLWPLVLTELGGISRFHPFILLLSQIEKYLYKKADAIITPQKNASDYISKRGGKEESIYWIPNGVSLSSIPSPSPLPENQTFQVLYAGSFGTANGLDTLLDAAKELANDNIEIELIGEGPKRHDLEKRIKCEHLTNVKLNQPLVRDALYQKMARADAFVVDIPDKMPYSYGLGLNKLFDYMALARPTVIGTSVLQNPITEHEAGIRTPAGDGRHMAQEIRHLCHLPKLARENMGRRARQAVEETYNFEHLGQELEKILKSLV